jgi:uncharacterized protein YhaN
MMSDRDYYQEWLQERDDQLIQEEMREADQRWEKRVRGNLRKTKSEQKESIGDFNPAEINTGCIMLDGILFVAFCVGGAFAIIFVLFAVVQIFGWLIWLIAGAG